MGVISILLIVATLSAIYTLMKELTIYNELYRISVTLIIAFLLLAYIKYVFLILGFATLSLAGVLLITLGSGKSVNQLSNISSQIKSIMRRVKEKSNLDTITKRW